MLACKITSDSIQLTTAGIQLLIKLVTNNAQINIKYSNSQIKFKTQCILIISYLNFNGILNDLKMCLNCKIAVDF